MRHVVLFALFATAIGASHTARSADTDPLCTPLRSFVSAVQPDETKVLTFHTRWGAGFKGEPGGAVYAVRCLHHHFAPAKTLCAYLMDHGAIEFYGNNVKRALSCLSLRTTFDSDLQLGRGAFSLSVGTPKRGSHVDIELAEDPQLGSMAMTIKVKGY